MNFRKKQLAHIFFERLFSHNLKKSKQKPETVFEPLNLLDLSFMILSFKDWWKYVKINHF